MHDIPERLQGLSNEKLMDVVKNFRQYGYSNDIRQVAIDLLKDRGIDEEQIKLAGNFSNVTYDVAMKEYEAHRKSSLVALVMYIVWLGLLLVSPASTYYALFIFIRALATVAYSIFFYRAYLNHSRFYVAIGKQMARGDELIYFFFGFPFYLLMYFFYRGQLKEELPYIK